MKEMNKNASIIYYTFARNWLNFSEVSSQRLTDCSKFIDPGVVVYSFINSKPTLCKVLLGATFKA